MRRDGEYLIKQQLLPAKHGVRELEEEFAIHHGIHSKRLLVLWAFSLYCINAVSVDDELVSGDQKLRGLAFA